MRTKGKWEIEGSVEHKTFYLSKDNRTICFIDKLEDAEYICKACNSHEQLVEIAKGTLSHIKSHKNLGDILDETQKVVVLAVENLLKELGE